MPTSVRKTLGQAERLRELLFFWRGARPAERRTFGIRSHVAGTLRSGHTGLAGKFGGEQRPAGSGSRGPPLGQFLPFISEGQCVGTGDADARSRRPANRGRSSSRSAAPPVLAPPDSCRRGAHSTVGEFIEPAAAQCGTDGGHSGIGVAGGHLGLLPVEPRAWFETSGCERECHGAPFGFKRRNNTGRP